MRKLILLLIPAALILTVSCNKTDNSANNNNTSGAKVRTIASVGSGFNSTDTFTYNNDGTLARRGHSYGGASIFTYSPGMVIESQYDQSGALTGSVTYTINGQGIADSAVVMTGSATYTYHKYGYDVDQHKILERVYDGSGQFAASYAWTYSNGNMIGEQFSDNLGNPYHTQIIGYTSIANTYANANTGQSYLGKSTANVPDHGTVTGTVVVAKYTYQYTLDGSSRVSNVTSFDSISSTTLSSTFTYY